MAYCTGKTIEMARGNAMKMLFMERKPVFVVANRFGVNRSTIWRWARKWQTQNQNIQLHNDNRQKENPTSNYRWSACAWKIPTLSSAPRNPHRLSPELEMLIIDTKRQLGRCAEVVYYHINYELCIKVSLSTVKRVLARHYLIKSRRKKRRKYRGIPRPKVLFPGDLIETDTIHLYNPVTGQKCYIYTVIDVYSRMTYARAYKNLRPGHSVQTILEAKRYFGFKFKMVQSDNGPEFSSYFEDQLIRRGIKIRHTRLMRPNDNAHIERFNRTIQEECTGRYYISSVTMNSLNKKILEYIDNYNHNRIHLGIECRTPASMLQRF